MSPNTDEENKKAEANVRMHVGFLFSRALQHEPADDLSTIRQYFTFIAERIDYKNLTIRTEPDLIRLFESIWLMLLNDLVNEHEKQQIVEIVGKEDLPRLFATISNLAEDDLAAIARVLRRRQLPTLIKALTRMFTGRITSGIDLLTTDVETGMSQFIVTPERLLSAKIALSRLAEILNYWSRDEFMGYDSSFAAYKDHYNPDLIDRNKILALISLFRVETKNSIDDEKILSNIEKQIDDIEKEIRKKRPKWSRVFAAIFVLFGFLADLKTLNPIQYEKPYVIVQQMVVIIHEDGGVQRATKPQLTDGSKQSKESLSHATSSEGTATQDEGGGLNTGNEETKREDRPINEKK